MAINVAKTEILRVGFRMGPAATDDMSLEATHTEGKIISTKDNC